MLGSALELKWNAKDLQSLQTVVRDYCPVQRRAAVQAGGCLGVFPHWLAKNFRRVYTFEPDPSLFRQMVANVPQGNVVMMQAALGCERGRMLRTECALRGNDGKTVLHEGMTRTEAESDGLIPTLCIDDLGLQACDLIYLDIEGDELFALQGAETTILQHRPIVVVEINRGLVYRGLTREHVVAYCNSLGYRFAVSLRSDSVFVPLR